MPSLEVADLRSCGCVSDTGVAALVSAAKGSLKVLTLNVRQRYDLPFLIQLIDQCEQLHSIRFSGQVSQELLTGLAIIAPRLQSLHVWLQDSASFDLEALGRKCTRLRQLHLQIPNYSKPLSLTLLSTISALSCVSTTDLEYEVADEDLVRYLRSRGSQLKSLTVGYHIEHDYSHPNVQLMAAIASNCHSLRCLKVANRVTIEPTADMSDVFKAVSKLSRLEISWANMSTKEIVSIGHWGTLTELFLTSVDLTDEALCALAPKLPLLETIDISCNDAVTHVGANAFAHHRNNIDVFCFPNSERVVADAVVEAVAANRQLCCRLKALQLVRTKGVVTAKTLRSVGMKCTEFAYLHLPQPPAQYPRDILGLFGVGVLTFERR